MKLHRTLWYKVKAISSTFRLLSVYEKNLWMEQFVDKKVIVSLPGAHCGSRSALISLTAMANFYLSVRNSRFSVFYYFLGSGGLSFPSK